MRVPAIAACLLLLSACVTTTTRTTEWSAGDARGGIRRGRVESIREMTSYYEGDRARGALGGALIGAWFGSLLAADDHHGRWGHHGHPSAGGAIVGAMGGAVIGAAMSEPPAEQRHHEILVRFEDGGVDTFEFSGPAAFRIGEPVAMTPRGLIRQAVSARLQPNGRGD